MFFEIFKPSKEGLSLSDFSVPYSESKACRGLVEFYSEYGTRRHQDSTMLVFYKEGKRIKSCFCEWDRTTKEFKYDPFASLKSSEVISFVPHFLIVDFLAPKGVRKPVDYENLSNLLKKRKNVSI